MLPDAHEPTDRMIPKSTMMIKPTITPELFRPLIHFTPQKAWINDPNGMVYYDGEYHLFYQYHPDSTVWGPMHWGHAVSRDLVNWEHLPIALYPDENGTIFSGSAVIDWHNTAGFGEEAMIAIFTHDKQPRQSQSIAYSLDKGRTWTKYEGNPVLPPPSGIRNFRDPKVFWYGTQEAGYWVMVLAVGQTTLFYRSADLKAWQSMSGFGLTEGAQCGIWETPDLFELPVAGTNETRWVLTLGINNCAPAGGSGTQYFVGHFDGERFTNENDKETVLWADYGADFYAAQSFSDSPDGRRIWMAWMSNWDYATTTPPETWRGAMSIPRELGLAKTADGIRLTQQPVAELQSKLMAETEVASTVLTDDGSITIESSAEAQLINATFTILPESSRFGIRVHVGDGQSATVGYSRKERVLFTSRSEAGVTDFNEKFTTGHIASLEADVIQLQIIVDGSAVEVFANDGTLVMTERIFTTTGSRDIEIFADGGRIQLDSAQLYEIAP